MATTIAEYSGTGLLRLFQPECDDVLSCVVRPVSSDVHIAYNPTFRIFEVFSLEVSEP